MVKSFKSFLNEDDKDQWSHMAKHFSDTAAEISADADSDEADDGYMHPQLRDDANMYTHMAKLASVGNHAEAAEHYANADDGQQHMNADKTSTLRKRTEDMHAYLQAHGQSNAAEKHVPLK